MTNRKEGEGMTKCPQCSGFGELADIFRRFVRQCPLCNGSGEVPDKHILWREQGRKLKAYRLDTLHLLLREAARKFGVDASNLSKMERGIIKPNANIYKRKTAYYCEFCQKHIPLDDGLFIHDDVYHPEGYVYDGGHKIQ